MEALASYVQPFFVWLLQTTVVAGILICLILAAQKLLGGRLGPRWCHALWLVLLIRMVLPWAPPSPVSLSNLIPASIQLARTYESGATLGHAEHSQSADRTPSGTAETPDAATVGTVSRSKPGEAARDAATPGPERPEVHAPSLAPVFPAARQILFALWLAGAIILGGYLFASNFALWRIVKREHPLVCQPILELFEKCKSQMDVQTLVALVPNDQVKSAALFGFLRPRLLLPRQMIETASRDEMRYVFLHELAHLKRHDIYLGWLVSLLQVLHWFNPLVWLAFHRMRTDRELACDAFVLTRTERDESREYGRTMVGLLERFSRSRRLPAMAGISESKSQLKRRIAMIARSEKPAYKMTPLAIMLILVVGCVSVPGPKHDGRSGVSTAEHGSGTTLRKLAQESGGFANISPDGRYLCDVDDWDDGNLTIRDLATGDRRPVTKNGPEGALTEYALDAAISPDSRKVAYLWYDEQTGTSNVWLAERDGSGRKLLCKDIYAMPRDWSADGRKILAIVYGPPHRMVWISASDGSIQQIKDIGKEYPAKFNVSPDGRFIAYDRPQADGVEKRDVFLYDIAENREIRLIETPADDVLLGWTPNGRSIFFLSDREGSWDGWLLDVRAGEPAGIPRVVKARMGKVDPIGFGRNGEYYFALSGWRRSVYTASFNPDTGSISALFSPTQHTGLQDDPDWSPDGKYLAYYQAEKEHATPVIHIRSLATGQERTIEPNLPLAADLRWAPDGRSLLVSVSSGKDGAPHLVYRVDAESGQRTELIRSEKTRKLEAQWLPDGKRILYCRLPSFSDTTDSRTVSLVIRDMDTGSEKELIRVERPDWLQGWALSPDGRQVVVKTTTGGVNVVSVDSGQTRELLGRDWAERIRIVACWSLDSSSIFLLVCPDLKSKPPTTELWRVAARGGQPEKLQTFEKLPLIRMRIHPSGKHVALVTHEGLDEMWVMENFLPPEAGK